MVKKSLLNNKKLKKLRKWKPSFLGVVFSLLLFHLSILPSLLARPPHIQGVVSGLSIAIGYGLGLATGATLRWFLQKEPSPKIKHIAWKYLYILGPLLYVTSIVIGVGLQNEVRHLLGLESIGLKYAAISVFFGSIVFLILFFLGKSIKRLAEYIHSRLVNRLPKRIAVATSILAVAYFVYIVLSGVLANGFFKFMDGAFGARNNTAPKGIVQPQEGLRSGTPDAVIGWDTLGFQGRGFIGGGPTKSQIEEFNGAPAKEPIRVYAGIKTADTAEERAEKAVEELKRVNAFDRKVLVIATTTGTGWLDPAAVDSVEFMHGGDTAIVSQQYSYLPSWVSFLVDQNRARDAGVALYDAVIEEYLKLPADQRPKLLTYGLSLGSFGGQEAYSSANDMRRSVDGAIFTGTPSSTELWSRITESRDPGSPQWQPTINGGSSVRFASNREDIIKDQAKWNDKTRILYLQHANDPVVWFNFDLLFNSPDWLQEERGTNISAATDWYPIVTFLQVGLDQAIAGSAPLKNAHWYLDTPSYAWWAVLPPKDWSIQKADKLHNFMDNEYTSARLTTVE